MPLSRNCKAWPATSWFSRSCKRGDSPAAGWEPELAPALRAPSVFPPQVCGVGSRRLGSSVSLSPAGRRTGRAAPQAATFPRSPTWAREENPGGPPGVTGLGGAPPRRMGGRERWRGKSQRDRRGRGRGFLLGVGGRRETKIPEGD